MPRQYFPTACPCLFCQPFHCLLLLLPICQSPTLTFHSEVLLKELGFWICLELDRATCCLFPSLWQTLLSSKQTWILWQIEGKMCCFQTCGRSCGAGEMTRTYAGQQERTEQGSRASSLRAALRYCLRWWAPICQLPTPFTDRFFNLQSLQDQELKKCCFFYFHNSGADKRLPWSKNYNHSCDIWGNVIYEMENFCPVFNVQVLFYYLCMNVYPHLLEKPFCLRLGVKGSPLFQILVWPSN